MKYPLVCVEWVDSCGCSSNWEYVENCDPSVLTCKSVGWMIHRDKKCVVIVPHLTFPTDKDKQQGCGDMTIPTASIVRMNRMRPIDASSCPGTYYENYL